MHQSLKDKREPSPNLRNHAKYEVNAGELNLSDFSGTPCNQNVSGSTGGGK
jgi:hypothetical protein